MTKLTSIGHVFGLEGRRHRLFEEWRAKAMRPIEDYRPPPPNWEPGTDADRLDEVAKFVRRYVVVSPEQADAIALWAAHTHAFWAAEATPYLQITSAEKESGKTLLLEVLEQLVHKPWRAVSPTTAALFRKIEIDQPTLLLDEYDTIFDGRRKDTDGLRAVLNAGNRSGATVPRAVGDGVRDYRVFCPKALAGIGSLPETIESRAITIQLKRRARDEQVEKLITRELEEESLPLYLFLRSYPELRRRDLRAIRPELPEQLNNRAADAWEPLLALAELIGGDWPNRARKSALLLSGNEEVRAASIGELLLTDIREVFDERDVGSISSADLVGALSAMEEAPWADYDGKALTQQRLARLLDPYGIKSKSVRIGRKTPKGYERAQFADAWKRYGSADPAPNNETPSAKRPRARPPARDSGLVGRLRGRLGVRGH